MARSKITIANNRSAVTDLVAITKDAMDKTNDHYLDLNGYNYDTLVLGIDNNTTEVVAITIKAGDSFEQRVLGDYSDTIAASKNYVMKLETSRYKDDDGYILIDIASTGTITSNYFWAAQN